MKLLLTKIFEDYGLNLTFVERVTKGFLSQNYVLSGNGTTKYFLKTYRFDDSERIREIHLVKKYFSNGGIPVILPLSDKKRNTFFLFEDKYFALFPFIPDKQLERGSFTETAIMSLGNMLGRVHLLGKHAALPIREKFKIWDTENALEKIEAIERAIDNSTYNEFDKLALESIRMKKELILSNEMTFEGLNLPSDHLIHGDFLDHNVFFDSDDKVSYVFDFEKTDYSPRMYELFRSLMYSFLSGDILGGDIVRAKLYLDSYLKTYPVSKNELSRGLKLFYLKSIHGVWVESEHYLKNNVRVDEFLAKDFQRTRYLSENYESLKNELLK